jgi:AAA domain-containing protein
MRSLYFYAAARSPKVMQSFIDQVNKNLQPFDRFLAQSIDTARQRQTRYKLPWEKIYDPLNLDLKPVDGRVLVPRRAAAWLITDWPPGAEPDLTSPFMVANRGLQLTVQDYRWDAAGLRLVLDEDLQDGDATWWCGRPCTVTRETALQAPATVTTTDGVPLRLVCPPQPEEDAWVLVLEDWKGSGPLIVDGERLQAQKLPEMQGLRRLYDAAGTMFEVRAGLVTVEEPPASDLLTGDNGVRFRWQQRRGRRPGKWVQLLLPREESAEEFIDPRAAFCEGDVEEVWTRPEYDQKAVVRVQRVDSEQYQLLLKSQQEWPPDGSLLHLPVDVHSLELQKRAVFQLMNAPLPHHRGLLRLCEDSAQTYWPRFQDDWPQQWASLLEQSRSGTGEQRAFVAKALGSPDLVMLEGPPGSGKTTAICELIQQLVARGQRVLLCASTHVAIDNVLERLIDPDGKDEPIYAVRIGHVDRVDERVQRTQLDERVAELMGAWRDAPHLQGLAEDELKQMATRVVVGAANLTCGTTMGIVRHPLLSRAGRNPNAPITKMPHWDVLIVDEASKTLIQEFLVPALMARRWVIVGDVQQLPPFNERADIVANLRSLADADGHSVFPPPHQRACLLRYWMTQRRIRRAGARWLIAEPPAVLDWLGQEFTARDAPAPSAVRVVARTGLRPGPFHEVSLDEIRAGGPGAVALAAYDWVLVADDLLPAVAGYLPADLLHHTDLASGEHELPGSHPLLFQHTWWLARNRPLDAGYKGDRVMVATFAEAERNEQRWFAGRDLASEIAWRLTRLHELKHSSEDRELGNLRDALRELEPAATDISEFIDQIRDVGFPSILEVLQEGIGGEQTTRPSALTEGLPRRQPEAFQARFGSLSYQHRMHPEISAFPRELIYRGRSLKDANTIEARDREIAWTFGPFRGRRAWIDVKGAREVRSVNDREVEAVREIVRRFLRWAERSGPPHRRSPRVWEVACLAFYVKQASALSDMLAAETGGKPGRSRFAAGNVEIVCGTVDRFQGREADLVLLSMRNTTRVGFLDSRNRLNVAVTRARQQLVVVGNGPFFGGCPVVELRELVRRSPRQELDVWLEGTR